MNATLTTIQREVLDFIRSSTARHGYAPSGREMAAHFGWKSQTASRTHLKALQRKGYLTFAPGKARSIILSGQSEYQMSADANRESFEKWAGIFHPELVKDPDLKTALWDAWLEGQLIMLTKLNSPRIAA